MALSEEEKIAVIAGSVAGFVLLLIFISAVVFICRKRKKQRRRSDQKPFRPHHLTPDTSLSKNSGPLPQHGDPRDPRLQPRLDPRLNTHLPKVGSNNLWFGNTALYSATPSQVYQDMKRKGGNRPLEEPPGLPVPPGHIVYQGSNMGRIYHSQQVAPSVYEPLADYRLQRGGSYMDLYSYPYSYDPYRDMNNPRPMLHSHHEEDYYGDKYREREVRRTGKKVKRSQSDVTLHSTRRPKNRKQRKEAPFDRQKSTGSRDSEDRNSYDQYSDRPRSRSNDRELNHERMIVAEVHKQKKKAPPPPMPKPKRDEIQAPARDYYDPEMTESATDSAKLRALERERERERLRDSEKAELKRNEENQRFKSDYVSDNRGFVDDEGVSNDLRVRPYTYEGKPSIYESSVVAKMAALTDTPKATYANRQSFVETSHKQGETNQSTQAFHAEVSKKLEELKDKKLPLDMSEGPVATSTGNHSRASRPTSASKERRRSRRGSNVTDQDGNVITEQAFRFLEGYSDGEGTDFMDSGSVTPTNVRDYDINL